MSQELVTGPLTRNARIFVAGHQGLVGSALVRALQARGHQRLILRTLAECDLSDAGAVDALFVTTQPEYVILAAAKVGGILANDTFPVDFLETNLKIQNAVISAAHRFKTRKLLFLGSSCIYPRLAPQPIHEDSLLTGPLEPTNEWYAIAKIAGIKLCQAYRKQYGLSAISLMPTNLYGPGDNFDLKSSHVLPALLRKFHEAKLGAQPAVTLWGTGTPRREFLHVDELADAALFLLENYDSPEIVNVGVGQDVTIAELADLVCRVVGYEGQMIYDVTKPDGTPRKLLDVSRLNGLGWRAKLSLEEGVRSTYAWFLEQQGKLRGR